MHQMIGAVYDPPKEGLPWLVVVLIPHQDAVICRPARDRNEAEILLEGLKGEVPSILDEINGA